MILDQIAAREELHIIRESDLRYGRMLEALEQSDCQTRGGRRNISKVAKRVGRSSRTVFRWIKSLRESKKTMSRF